MADAGLGCSVGTGWAVLVTVVRGTGDGGGPVVVDRRRVELVEGPGRFVYHLAAERPLAEAGELAARSQAAAGQAATGAVGEVVRAAATAGHQLVQAAVVGPAAQGVPTVAEALRTHAGMHAAEGRLYRGAVHDACRAAGLGVDRVPARDLLDQAALALDRLPEDVTALLAALGKELGPPWRREHKDAALAAWLSLPG
jgi:hypothetical protein